MSKVRSTSGHAVARAERMIRGFKSFAMAVCVTFAMASLCHACPTCKQGIAEGSQHAGMVRGYFWSILFMMSMPFLIFGGLGAYFYYQVRLARAGRLRHSAPTSSIEPEPITSA